jgi:uncharacterized protein (DUF1778 family)
MHIHAAIFNGMEPPASVPNAPARKAVAMVEPSSSVDPKGSVNMRIGARTRQLIDDAAAVLGQTRTEFMVESARRHAMDVLLDQRLFALAPEGYDAFAQALETPSPPGPKLRALAHRPPAWKR